jgi:hypothetical protein
MARSILAIAVGLVFIAALSFGADALLRVSLPEAFDGGRIENVPIPLFTMLYVALFAMTGCYLTARLAPREPMAHALVVGAFGVVLHVAALLSVREAVPLWYSAAGVLLVLPSAWLGGRLRERELASLRRVAVRRAPPIPPSVLDLRRTSDLRR